jgi:type IV pilus assembly protein PilA
MKTNKNVKGFTLVELIVVIAIIGVLAAILVPSMLGYVKKSNVAAANSNAKTLYNAVVTCLTDMDAKGTAITYTNDTDAKTITNITNYFSNVGTLEKAQCFVKDGACTSAWVQKGTTYRGCYPKQTSSDDNSYKTNPATPTAAPWEYLPQS